MDNEMVPAKHSEAEETEAYHVLLGLSRKKTGAIPAEMLVAHVLRIYRGADWPVRRAAMEALLRRIEFARRDGLAVATRPAGGSPLGIYATRRGGESARRYSTLLRSVELLEGSCDCPDFLRGSLGLCKHLLTVLENLASRKRAWKEALAARPGPSRLPRLCWNPVRPLVGRGDWLERLELVGPGSTGRAGSAESGRRARPTRDGRAPAGSVLQRWRARFTPGVGNSWIPKSAFPDRPERRLELVSELLLAGRARGGELELEPAVRELLRHEKALLERLTADQRDQARLRRALRSLKVRLYPFQREGVERFLARGRLLLADDMGLGKTVQAVAACTALHATGKVRRGLVIVPASLKPQWLREWQSFSKTPVALVDGSAEERRELYRRKEGGFLIANYEQVLRDLEAMREWKPELVVLDEAQRIKNWATKTAAYVKELKSPYRLVLTGTPMENRLEELASILDWVDDQALEPKWRLVPWHSSYADGSMEVRGARNLETLRERLAHCMVRRQRSEVLSQLPPRTDTQVPITLTEAQLEAHDGLNQPIAQLARIAKKRPLTQAEFLKLMTLLMTQRIIANGLAQLSFLEVWPRIEKRVPDEALLQGLDSPKLLELRELVRNLVIQQGRKVVVFSQWRRMLRLASWAVGDLLVTSGLRAAFFTGKEGPKQRTRNLVDFHDDPEMRVLFASDAGGVGLNLQRAASACINLELPWNPAVLEQRIGRIYRIGQKRPIDVYNLIGQGCIEERIAGLVNDKKALFRGLFDGASDEIHFERSGRFLSKIERIVEAAVPPPAAGAAGVEAPEPTAESEAAAEHELDAVLAAADESRDSPGLAEHELVGEREPEHGPEPAPTARPQSAARPSEVERLFQALSIQPTEGGGLRIEAAPQAAESLAALFEGMARLLRGAAQPGASPGGGIDLSSR